MQRLACHKIYVMSPIYMPSKRQRASHTPLLTEPSVDDQEEFFEHISNLDCHPSILSVHHKHNKPYLPSSKSKRLPQTITSLHDKAKDGVSYEELIECAIAAHRSYKISKEETENLEELTRLQARCRLWGYSQSRSGDSKQFQSSCAYKR